MYIDYCKLLQGVVSYNRSKGNTNREVNKMTQQVNSRKKHITNGNVAEIKKQDQALGLGQNNRKESLFASLFKSILKKGK